MKLTPMDIHNKEFNFKMRGYDEKQVDEFLDEVIDAYSDALDRITDLENQQQEVASTPKAEPANSDPQTEASELLLSAQKSADLIRANAEAEAARIIEEAKQNASGIQVNEAEQEQETELKQNIATLQSDYERLLHKVADYREKTRMLFQKEIEQLDDENWQYWLDKYYGTERIYPENGQPVSVDTLTNQDPANLDNSTIHDVLFNNGVQEANSGDNTTTAPAPEQDLTGMIDDGPVIIFPEDLDK